MRTTRTFCFTAIFLALPLIVGCGDDDDDDDDDDVTIDADVNAPDAPDNTPDAAPPPDAPVAEFCTPQSGTNLQLVEVASGLTDPVYVTAPSGDPRLFIVEQPGRIRIVKNGNLLGVPFLDIDSIVRSSGNEQGLLGLAFHPDYGTNGKFYVHYSATSPSGDGVIAEYTVSAGDPDVADTNEVRLMVVDQTQSNHNGGWIGFGPDGYLYISFGDGGGANDSHPDGIQKGQNLDYLLGKILRIDVDTGDPYGIPADNPYVGIAGEDEIWAFGLRNAWRNSFDRDTGDFYIADVGQGAREEIDFQPAASTGGENYGWVHYEGSNCFDPPGADCTGLTGYTFPITEFTHGGGRCSVTGGYVYRGECLTDWDGVYFYGDYCSGQVFTFVESGGVATMEDDITNNIDPTGLLQFNLSSFGEDAFGELYITSLDGGAVYRIAIQ